MTARLANPPKPVVGPYARVLWDRESGRWVRRLTAEGRQLVADYLAPHEPTPGKVLAAVPKWAGLFRTASRVCGDDEVHQSARYGAAMAACRYEPGRGVSFVTVAVIGIRGAVSTALRDTVIASRRAGLFSAGSDWLDGPHDGPPGRPTGEWWPPEDWQTVLSVLPELEREAVVGRVCRGELLTETGLRIGRSRERVRQLYVSARRTLREAFPDWCEGGEGVGPAGGLRGGLGR